MGFYKVLERIRSTISVRVPATISTGINGNVGSVEDVSGRARGSLRYPYRSQW